MANNQMVPPPFSTTAGAGTTGTDREAGVSPKMTNIANGADALAALKAQLEKAQAEITRLKAAGAEAEAAGNPAPVSLEALPAEQALELLVKDPVRFVQELMERSAEKHLWNLKEEAELRGALNVARRAHPEFERFEPFIMHEVELLIQNDPDGVIDPWDKLLEKGVETFRRKFQETLKESPEMLSAPGQAIRPEAFMEGKTNRLKPEVPPSFSREQIAKMSLDEFLKNETAINEALKNNRIK